MTKSVYALINSAHERTQELSTVGTQHKPGERPKEKTTAALTNDDPLVCPVCKGPMQRVMGGNNTPMLICEPHKVAMPVPNGV